MKTFWDCIEALVIQDLKLIKDRIDNFNESLGEPKTETPELDKIFKEYEEKKKMIPFKKSTGDEK